MKEQYLKILKESLLKKIDVLDEILRISERQSQILKEEDNVLELFDQCVDDKDICIKKLQKLDQGFETVYAEVSGILKNQKEDYRDFIHEMQELITEITEKSVQIQALEERNRKDVESLFKRERKQIQGGKRSVNAAMNYYKSMNHPNPGSSRYMDQKK